MGQSWSAAISQLGLRFLLYCTVLVAAVATSGSLRAAALYQLTEINGASIKGEQQRADTLSHANAKRVMGDAVTMENWNAWLRLDLQASQTPRVLHLANPFVDAYTLYDDTGAVLAEGGSTFPGNKREHFHPEFLISLEGETARSVYLNLRARPGSAIPIRELPLTEERSASARRILGDGIYYGAMVLMVLLASSVAVLGHNGHAARLSVTLIAWLLAMSTNQGYSDLLLWPGASGLSNFLIGKLLLAASISSAWFSYHFLRGVIPGEKLLLVLRSCMWVCIALIPGSWFFDITLAANMSLVVTGANVFAAAIVAARHGDQAAKYLVGSAVFASAPFALVPLFPVLQNMIVVTGCTSLVLVVIALMARLNGDIQKNQLNARLAENRSQFLAAVSHEIRTPLNGIIGLIELCRQHTLPAEVRGYMQSIHRSSRMLGAIVNDILDFSKLDAGAMQIEPLPTHLPHLFQDTLAAVETAAQQNCVTLRTDVAAELQGWMLTDPNRLTQILVNLTSNAVKFTKDGSVSICATLRHRKESSWVDIAITDTGIGMAPEALATLFNPFTQASESTARVYGGTGLGLSISKQLAGLLGGDIRVESTPDEGSCFTLSIPFEACAEPKREPSNRATQGELTGLRVLLAEDNAVNRLLATRLLEKQGARVILAENGLQAIDQVANQHIDLILMDMEMPGMGGLQATRDLRRRGNSTPIIAMTANTSAEDEEACLSAGMNAFITKPLDSGIMLETLGVFARKKPGQRGIQSGGKSR